MVATTSGGTLAVLKAQQGVLAGQQFPVTRPSVTIGRTADNDIIINDPDVSRHHARLSWDGRQFIIEDLGSTNGTFVNNVRVTAPHPVSSGASLRLGALSLTFQSFMAAAAPDPITNADTRVMPQPPAAAAYPQSYAPPSPARTGGSTPWPLILGGGAVLLLFLVAAGAAAFLFLKPGKSAPATSITSPLNGAQVTLSEPVQVVAVVNDERGISSVELWVNGELEDIVGNADARGLDVFPVQFQWAPEQQGSQLLEIRPYTRNGQTGEFASVVVKAAPGTGAVAGGDADGAVGLVVATATGQAGSAQGTPALTPGPDAAGCTSNAAYVADVTIPDYTEVSPGQRIDKVWRIRNSGTCAWNAGYQLAYASGDLMNAAASQAVSPASPGGTADVQVTMYAPEAPGTYRGVWRMRDAAGLPFGTELTVVVVVPSAVVPTPTWTLPIAPPGGEGCSPSIDFRADDDVIEAGESTIIRWDVECVREVYFEGEPVTGHESREVSPSGVTAYTLRVVRNDGGTEERRVTVGVTMGDVGVVEDEPTEIRVSVSLHSYDPDTGVAWFEVTARSDSLDLTGRVDRRIWNYSSDEVYYYGYNLHSFYLSPAPGPVGSLHAGETRYIQCTLEGRPEGVRCRGEFKFDSGSPDFVTATERLDFALPAASGGGAGGAIGANISYHSYDRASRWVTFRVVNTGGVTLESAKAAMNASSMGMLYGPASSDSPFRDSPTSDALVDSVAPGATRYMRYRLREAPPGTAVSTTIELYSEEGLSGQSLTRTLGFILP